MTVRASHAGMVERVLMESQNSNVTAKLASRVSVTFQRGAAPYWRAVLARFAVTCGTNIGAQVTHVGLILTTANPPRVQMGNAMISNMMLRDISKRHTMKQHTHAGAVAAGLESSAMTLLTCALTKPRTVWCVTRQTVDVYTKDKGNIHANVSAVMRRQTLATHALKSTSVLWLRACTAPAPML